MTALEQVTRYLESELGLPAAAPAATLAELVRGHPKARSFRLAGSGEALRLRVGGYHDVLVQGWVLDWELGSVGLIHEVEAGRGGGDWRGTFERWLGDAAHVRHLLGMARTERGSPAKPVQLPAIEVVFLITGAGEAGKGLLGEMQGVLRDLFRESGLLHAISVNVAVLVDGDEEAGRRALRRAFCWLLPAARRWFGSIPAPNRPRREWNGVELENFRRAGTRRWRKASRAGLHLVHGPNGSGKSTLAEAFEYAVTGHSTRLGEKPTTSQPETHVPLIHRGSGVTGAKVRIVKDGADVEPPRLVPPPSDAPPPPAGTLHGGSLRLDQDLCDRLARETPTKRAETWLRTFFGESERARQERGAARAAWESALEILVPGWTKEGREAELAEMVKAVGLVRQGTAPGLNAFVAPWSGPGWAEMLASAGSEGLAVQDGVGVTLAIRHLEGGIPARRFAWDPSDREEVAKRLRTFLARDLRELASWQARNLPDLESLLERIGQDSFEDAPGGGVGDGEDRATTFNRWLRAVAMTDLLEKALVIARTHEGLSDEQRGGRGAGGTPDASFEVLAKIAPRLPVEKLKEHWAEARTTRDDLRVHLSQPVAPEAETVQAREKRRVVRHEIEPFLEAVEAGFFGTLLGKDATPALRRLLTERRTGEAGSMRVGYRGWTQPLIEWVRRRRAFLDRCNGTLLRPAEKSTDGAVSEAAKARSLALVLLVEAVATLAGLESGAEAAFVKLLEKDSLGLALDEVVALLTPARWAYDALVAKVNLGREASLELSSYDVDVGKILNTAELNALALALYLLCAPRVDNPYRVVFLDDPLQNMDELTVGAIARGMARLLRLWQGLAPLKDWDVVLLLHGEEDCERFLLEGPAAHYRIPWMGPKEAGGEEKTIESERRGEGEMIPLAEFIEVVR